MFNSNKLKLKIEKLEKEKISLEKLLIDTVTCMENEIQDLKDINLNLEMSYERIKKTEKITNLRCIQLNNALKSIKSDYAALEENTSKVMTIIKPVFESMTLFPEALKVIVEKLEEFLSDIEKKGYVIPQLMLQDLEELKQEMYNDTFSSCHVENFDDLLRKMTDRTYDLKNEIDLYRKKSIDEGDKYLFEYPSGVVNVESFFVWLKLNGFKSFVPKSKNWAFGGAKMSKNDGTLYLFFARTSVGFIHLEFGEVLPNDENDKVSTAGYNIFRKYYRGGINVFEHTARLVEDFIEGKDIEKHKVNIPSK